MIKVKGVRYHFYTSVSITMETHSNQIPQKGTHSIELSVLRDREASLYLYGGTAVCDVLICW
jgi:hypothetical protein